MEHGLPLMLRVPEIGSRFSELLVSESYIIQRMLVMCMHLQLQICDEAGGSRYFVCVHKGGENFSLSGANI